MKGIFNRVISVIDTNKLALVINAGDLTPMAAIVRKKLNYYVITTNLYIFTINTNDIIVIEEAGEATVDVSIVPTLLSGVKVADFAIGATEGSIYVPEQKTEINDNTTSDHTTWSSDKLSSDLALKADLSSLAPVATSGDYDDLTNKPTIPVLTDLIDDTTTTTTSVWSSDKTAAEIAAGAGVTIDDTTTSTTKTWSSDKINSELSNKADVSTIYTKTEVDTALNGKANSSDVYTKTQIDTALSGKANTSDITTINGLLNGYSFEAYNLEGNGGLLTLPSYNDSCIIFIARGGSGLYIGHWTGVTTLINDSSFQVNYYANPSRINVINNGNTTAKVTVIRK